MPLSIKNDTVERLATEAARRLGVTKTEAVRRALEAPLERSADASALTGHHATLAADALATYGRGRHPASPNFGDCMTYAVARSAHAPLPFVGNDFSWTDLEPALT